MHMSWHSGKVSNVRIPSPHHHERQRPCRRAKSSRCSAAFRLERGQASPQASLRLPPGAAVRSFLMLDDFHTSNPSEYLAGFPWHPHRGIETITYILDGLVEHGDSMGNQG